MVFAQTRFDIRCEWGAHGISALLPDSDVIIVVDVLSFSTCVSVAVHNGAIVFPFFSETITVENFAKEKTAILATKKRQSTGYSLSPTSLSRIPEDTRIVLPSPNGSRLSTMTGDTPTIAGCLRNAKAVADYAQSIGKRISVIPAGERWFPSPDLRPSMEDMLGAGAVIHYLSGEKSIEAQSVEHVFLKFKDDLPAIFQQFGSGLELIEKGFADDVAMASQLNVSDVIPLLQDGAYQSA